MNIREVICDRRGRSSCLARVRVYAELVLITHCPPRRPASLTSDVEKLKEMVWTTAHTSYVPADCIHWLTLILQLNRLGQSKKLACTVNFTLFLLAPTTACEWVTAVFVWLT